MKEDLDLSDRHLLRHDWESVDRCAPVLHECEEIVEEAFSGRIHVELVQLSSQEKQLKQSSPNPIIMMQFRLTHVHILIWKYIYSCVFFNL